MVIRDKGRMVIMIMVMMMVISVIVIRTLGMLRRTATRVTGSR